MWLNERQPKDLDSLVSLTDHYLETHRCKGKGTQVKKKPVLASGKSGDNSKEFVAMKERKCYACGEMEHIATNCLKGQTEKQSKYKGFEDRKDKTKESGKAYLTSSPIPVRESQGCSAEVDSELVKDELEEYRQSGEVNGRSVSVGVRGHW